METDAPFADRLNDMQKQPQVEADAFWVHTNCLKIRLLLCSIGFALHRLLARRRAVRVVCTAGSGTQPLMSDATLMLVPRVVSGFRFKAMRTCFRYLMQLATTRMIQTKASYVPNTSYDVHGFI